MSNFPHSHCYKCLEFFDPEFKHECGTKNVLDKHVPGNEYELLQERIAELEGEICSLQWNISDALSHLDGWTEPGDAIWHAKESLR